MLTYKVGVNGEPAIIGGMEGLKSLHLQIAAVKDHPIHLHFGGIADGTSEHVTWIRSRELEVGDRVTVEVAESLEAETPVERSSGNEPERILFELSKATYLRLRAKFEPDAAG